MRDVRRAGARTSTACCSSPCSASAWSPSWSTCSRSGCAARRWPGCRCSPSTRCRSRSTPTASPPSRSSSAPLGFLWLLVTDNVDRVRRFGRRFTGDGRDVDVWEPSPLAAAGRRLAVVGVLVAVLLPLAVPGHDRRAARPASARGSATAPATGGSGRGSGSVDLFAALERPAQPDRGHATWSRSPPTSRTRSTCASASPTSSAPTASQAATPSGRPVSRRPAATRPGGPARGRRSSQRYQRRGRGHQEPRHAAGAGLRRRRSTPTAWTALVYDPNQQVVYSNRARLRAARSTRSTTSAPTYTPGRAAHRASRCRADNPVAAPA